MDNLEFMQWFKRFFEMNVSDVSDYDSVGQRCKGKGGSTFQFAAQTAGGAANGAKPAKPAAAPSRIASAPHALSTNNNHGNVQNSAAPAAAPKKEKEPAAAAAKPPAASKAPAAKPSTAASAHGHGHGHGHTQGSSQELTTLRAAHEEQGRAYAELKLEVDGLEKERDFYFDKLRDIEIMLQVGMW
jgi:RP/EB family microtubule-associated protein